MVIIFEVYLLGLAMRPFFPMRIDAHWRILAHICIYSRIYSVRAFGATAWPTLISIPETEKRADGKTRLCYFFPWLC